MAVYLSQGRMLPYVLIDSCFFHTGSLRLFFFLNTSLSPQSLLALVCQSGSIRSRIKVSGHLPSALEHEGERFSDQSKKQLTEPPPLLFQYQGCLSWQLCPGSERPDVMPASSHCSSGAVGQCQGKHMTSVLSGAEPAQWLETTAPMRPIIAHWGESQQIEKRKEKQREETKR